MIQSTNFNTFEEFLEQVLRDPGYTFDTFDLIKDRCLDGLLLEFGVAEGFTLFKLNDCFEGTRAIHGFDSFNGLPEDWRSGYPAGTFACVPPTVPDNITLHIGLFQDTLDKFLAEHPENVAFLHLDADLYSSTDFVMRRLENRLVPGSLVYFDELIYPCNEFRQHEYKAFIEHHERTGLHYGYLGRRNQEAYAFRVI